MDTSSRIFSLLDKMGMEQKKFASLIGTTDKTVSAWRTGRSKSYTKYIPQIAAVLGTTTEYLLTGKEATTAHEKEGSNAIVAALETLGVSREALMIALAYDRADEKSRAFARIALSIEGPASPGLSGGAM